MSEKIRISQVQPRLTVFSDEFYRGARRTFFGNVGLRNLEVLLDGVESLRFFSTNPGATLVVFSRVGFKGNFRVFRGSRNLQDLDDLISGNDVESLISSNRRLTISQIRFIRSTGRLPEGFRLI